MASLMATGDRVSLACSSRVGQSLVWSDENSVTPCGAWEVRYHIPHPLLMELLSPEMTTPCGAWSPYTKKLASYLLNNERSSYLFLCYIKFTESNLAVPFCVLDSCWMPPILKWSWRVHLGASVAGFLAERYRVAPLPSLKALGVIGFRIP